MVTKSNLSGAEFTFAVKKNKDLIAGDIAAMDEIRKPGYEYEEYQKDLTALFQKHAERDAEGNPIKHPVMITPSRKGEMYKIKGIDDPASEYRKEVDALNERFADVIAGQQAKEEEHARFMEKECDIDLVMVSIKDVPNAVNQFIMDRIIYMITD